MRGILNFNYVLLENITLEDYAKDITIHLKYKEIKFNRKT